MPGDKLKYSTRSCAILLVVSMVYWDLEQQDMERFWSIESSAISLVKFATHYDDSCYGDDPMVDCNRLEHREISWHETRKECPFENNACMTGREAITFVTEHMRLVIFRLTRPDANDLTFGRRMSCAPMDATLFQTHPRHGKLLRDSILQVQL